MTKAKFKSYLVRLLLLFLGLIALYYLLLVLGYSLPDHLLRHNFQESLHVLAQEPKRWDVMTGITGTRLDNFTDRLMFQKLENTAQLPAWQAALWNEGYVRYWLGTLPLLRFLLLFMNYTGIRYLNLWLGVPLFALVLGLIKQHLGRLAAAGWLLTHLLMHAWIFPLSLQYASVYYLTLLATAFLCWQKAQLKATSFLALTFFTVGSLTNYFDLLTAPLLTLGLPLLVAYQLKGQEQSTRWQQNFTFLAVAGLNWGLGYAGTWLMKWTLGSFILKENVWANALRQMGVRTVGAGSDVRPFRQILGHLLNIAFPKYVLILLLLLLLVIGFYGRKTQQMHWPRWRELTRHSGLIFLALAPFVWCALLQNHNQNHSYFTYRHFALTLFSLWSYAQLTCWQARPLRSPEASKEKAST